MQGTFCGKVFVSLAKIMLLLKGGKRLSSGNVTEYISLLDQTSELLFKKKPEDVLSPKLIKSQYDSLHELLTKIRTTAHPCFLVAVFSNQLSESEHAEIFVSSLLMLLIQNRNLADNIKILTEIEPNDYLNKDKLTQDEYTKIATCHEGLKAIFSDD